MTQGRCQSTQGTPVENPLPTRRKSRRVSERRSCQHRIRYRVRRCPCWRSGRRTGQIPAGRFRRCKTAASPVRGRRRRAAPPLRPRRRRWRAAWCNRRPQCRVSGPERAFRSARAPRLIQLYSSWVATVAIPGRGREPSNTGPAIQRPQSYEIFVAHGMFARIRQH